MPIKAIVDGAEKEITRIPVLANGMYKDAWEVRDNQDRLLWYRDDTITGVSPISFRGYGIPLKSVKIVGNSQQTGTPSPDNIIMPTFCGVRTANLFDATGVAKGRINSSTGEIGYTEDTPVLTYSGTNNEFTITTSVGWRGFVTGYIDSQEKIAFSYTSDETFNVFWYAYDINKNYLGAVVGGVPTGTKYMRGSIQCPTVVKNAKIKNIMLNSGSTPLPYEPYGWAEKITNAGQTVPIYLGEVPTVRRIKKMVLTGTETVESGSMTVYIQRPDMLAYSPVVCSHYQYFDGLISGAPDMSIATESGAGTSFWFKDSGYGNDAAGFKSYLAAQYAAGTPVTVWYVLAEPETAIVNEPLCKIGNYADELITVPGITPQTGTNTLTVDTTLGPSQISITGHVKEVSA